MQTPILGLLNQNYLWEEAKKESIYIHLCTHINRYLTIQFIYLQIKFTKLYKYPTINFTTPLFPPKEAPYLLAVTSHFPSFQLWATTDQCLCLLPLCLGIAWIYPLSGVIQHVVFCKWLFKVSVMFSRFIHVVTCISNSFPFIA